MFLNSKLHKLSGGKYIENLKCDNAKRGKSVNKVQFMGYAFLSNELMESCRDW
jgi:hypothetical protein